MSSFTRLLALSSLLAACAPVQAAPGWGPDVTGGQDHPLIQRFSRSWLFSYEATDFDATTVPTRVDVLGPSNAFVNPLRIEGKITRLLYLAPPGKRRLEVHRNYEQALVAAGAQVRLSCAPPACDKPGFPLSNRLATMRSVSSEQMERAAGRNDDLRRDIYRVPGPNGIGADDQYFTYATLSAAGQTRHVMIHTAKVYDTDLTTTYIEIAEPRPMPAGQVTVNARDLDAGLKEAGRIALYGIYFDTGRAEVKPESRPQLEEMAKLLKAQPQLRAFIVGHTDNQGGLDANLALSAQRAQAVVTALVSTYKIDPKRLAARGVASLAPVAGNSSEQGRARNRRVELVAQ